MRLIPVTVAETASFRRAAERIMTAEEVAALIDLVAHEPTAGDLIEGTGGLRKLRWRLAGRGKRGGARVIYYFHDHRVPLYLLFAYPKSAADDLSADQKRALRAMVDELKRGWRR